MSTIERIYADEKLIAILVSHEHRPESTEFVTTPDLTMQVGFVKYPKGGTIQAHLHRHLERHIEDTNEVLFVREGKVEIFLYDDNRQPVAQRFLEQGDLILLISGGHGFRMLEDTVLLEVKQGPYIGVDEKERF
jgi:mannose-6-phosphate isomerase-like protein (cupin superfamily)